jgi:hypothetical protein
MIEYRVARRKGRYFLALIPLLCNLAIAADPKVGASEKTDPKKSSRRVVKEWKGLPVHPAFVEGREAGKGYVYSAKVPFGQVESFYREKMKAKGWEASTRQKSDRSLIGGGPMLSLDFRRGKKAANVMLIFSEKEQQTMVMLTWLER